MGLVFYPTRYDYNKMEFYEVIKTRSIKLYKNIKRKSLDEIRERI